MYEIIRMIYYVTVFMESNIKHSKYSSVLVKWDHGFETETEWYIDIVLVKCGMIIEIKMLICASNIWH